MEQKELEKFKIKGKDGIIKANVIQRHLPTENMCLIKTKTHKSLFCQINHPIIVKRNNKTISIEAKEIIIEKDKIWVDNSIVFNNESILPEETPNKVFSILSKCLEYKEIEYLNGTNYMKGNHIRNLRLVPFFIKLDKDWLENFIVNFIAYQDVNHLKIYSYNLVQQLNLICDRINYYFDVNIVKEKEEIFFVVDIRKKDEKDKKRSNVIGYDTIIDYKVVSGYDYYVYDIKTNTGEYMNGCVQNHNSFHTGGALVLQKVDIKKEFSINADTHIKEFIYETFEQTDNDLVLKNSDEMILTINKNLFNEKYPVEIDSVNKTVYMSVGYFNLIVGSVNFDCEIEQPLTLYFYNDIVQNDNKIIIKYFKNQKILQLKPHQLKPDKVATSIDDLVSGKSPWTSPENMFRKFFNILKHFGDADSCHLEVIVSNIFRNKENPQYPARIKEPYDPVLYSIKDLPSVISYPLGIAYENFGKSIKFGMVSERSSPTDIEKIIFGEPLVKKVKK